MEMHSAHPSKPKPGLLGTPLVTFNRALFWGCFRAIIKDAYEFPQHILVRNAHAQAFARLLGGFSGLPAPLPGGVALARSRQSFRRRLTFPLRPHSFIGLIALLLLWAEGINTQQFLKRG
jgi:hypothetical protein